MVTSQPPPLSTLQSGVGVSGLCPPPLDITVHIYKSHSPLQLQWANRIVSFVACLTGSLWSDTTLNITKDVFVLSVST